MRDDSFFLQLIIDFLQRHQIGKNWKNLRWKLNFFGELARGLRWIAFVRWLGQLKGNQLWILQNFTMTQMKRDGLIEWEVRNFEEFSKISHPRSHLTISQIFFSSFVKLQFFFSMWIIRRGRRDTFCCYFSSSVIGPLSLSLRAWNSMRATENSICQKKIPWL